MHLATTLARAASGVALAAAVIGAAPATAATLASYNLTTGIPAAAGYYGQSFTAAVAGDPAGQTYNGLQFSFISGGSDSAAELGRLYLFTQAYAGSANSLSGVTTATTPTFLGYATGSNNVYTFDPGVAITNGVKYYAYSNAAVAANGATGDPYAGGEEYFSGNSGGNLFGTAFSGKADLGFRITGTAVPAAAVPEPASWALMIGGVALAGAALRRRGVELARHAAWA